MTRPTSMTVIAWLLIVGCGGAALFDIYGFAKAVPPYPQWVWAALFVSKCGGVAAGVMLLKMLRLAVWIYLATVISAWTLSLGVTSSYTHVAWWRYAEGVLGMAIYAFFIVRHWDKLLPQNTAGAVHA